MPKDKTATINNNNVANNFTPIIVIGAGLAGLFAALKLAPRHVTVISPTSLGQGASSCWAQGGIAAAIGEGDHPDKHAIDTINAGCGIVNPDIAYLVANEAAERIHDLLSYGVPFDKDLEGKLILSREAAHSDRRIVRVKGDMAGKAIMNTLIETARQTPSINIIENHRAEDLSLVDNKVTGITISNCENPGQKRFIKEPLVIIASGGIGGLFTTTTNPETSLGEGLGLAARAGAVIADPEFIQFHPTAINTGISPAPLATEALRGEGATLIDNNGRRFMPDYHPDAELAPRDIVARAVYQQVASGKGAFLNCTDAIGASFSERYPTVFEKCMTSGINPAKDPIPVAPAAHYHMGGILTDKHGRTTIQGLWACGEAASTGMHGANRLASNSLLEAVVFADRIAKDINCTISPKTESHWQQYKTDQQQQNQDINHLHYQFKKAIVSGLGVVRNNKNIRKLIYEIEKLKPLTTASKSFTNTLAAAEVIAYAALERTESRGGHYRSDYPEQSTLFAARSYYQFIECRIVKLSEEDITFPET